MDVWKRGKPFAMVVCPSSATIQSQSNLPYRREECLHFFVFAFGRVGQLVETEERMRLLTVARGVQNSSSHEPVKDANVYCRQQVIPGYGGLFKSFGEPRNLQLLRYKKFQRNCAIILRLGA